VYAAVRRSLAMNPAEVTYVVRNIAIGSVREMNGGCSAVYAQHAAARRRGKVRWGYLAGVVNRYSEPSSR